MSLRFTFVVASSPLFVAWVIPRANYMIKHKEKYSLEKRYKFAQFIMKHMRKRAFTRTLVYGEENLPKKGGYVMYSNHQGKYDALGIFLSHKKQCSVLWEEKSADRILARQVKGLLDGETIGFKDFKGQIRTLNKIAEQVAGGRRYLIFPEGGYKNNRNNLQEFKTGCFVSSIKSKTPIIPVAIYDSWKSMDTNNLKPVTTQVHFLQPILYEEYANLRKNEICDMVKQRIKDKINELNRLGRCPEGGRYSN